jgi:zinc and cadmium transporter
MNHQDIYAVLSVIAVSLISFVGLLTLSAHAKFGKKLLTILVSFSAGALLGDVFIHLLPELAREGVLDLRLSLVILGSVIGFFALEQFIHWHHHHMESDESEHAHHPVAYLNLVGDGMHNIIDGLIIGGAYMIDIQLGVATTVAVILHEIPQEVGDFGVLLYAGFSKAKALFYNFLSALTSLIGVAIALSIRNTEHFADILVAIGIGSFLYIAVADLIPEIHKTKGKAVSQFITMLFGIGIMFLLLLLD